MFEDIYLRYLNRYIDNGEWRGCEERIAAGRANDALDQFMAFTECADDQAHEH